MSGGWHSAFMVSVEEAKPEDIVFIREIANDVFCQYGDYSNIITKFFSAQGVSTFIARVPTEVGGFAMMGFLPWSGGEGKGNSWIADLLAIAVKPELQRQGIGTALMQGVMQLIQEMSEWRDIHEIQLTCAESNRVGLDFFVSKGFHVVDPVHGKYSSGQRAVRLSKRWMSPKPGLE